MRGFLREKLAGLSGCSSGNATLVVALGMPMLLGGAGLGVDMAQWYMWKRELQFAVDQAAVAAAWARAETATQATYKTRATQEFNANLAAVEDFATLNQADISLADYKGGTNNSVIVEATATRALPFSQLLTGKSATIYASAQAVIEGGQIFTACMLAVDPDASGAFTLGGSVSGNVTCGFGALSDSDTAMVKNGNSNAKAGFLVSSGGIDRGFSSNGTINAYVGSLTDPFEDLTPPDSPVSRTYVCPPVSAGTTTTTADVTTRTQYTYTYKAGKNKNNATNYAYSPAKQNTTTTEGPVNRTVDNGTTAGTSTTSPVVIWTEVGSSGKDTIWEVRTTTTTTTYANVVATTTGGSDGIARPQPGTYSSISIACTTQFAPGVYVINGNIDFGQNKTVTGSDLMFVLKGSDGIHINSKSNVSLGGITAATLQDYGMTSTEATKLAGMLIYDTESSEQIKMNGGADVKLNGIMYVPKREVWFNGNSDVTGKCLMIAAGKITFTGNNNISSACVPANVSGMKIGGAEKSVKLVA